MFEEDLTLFYIKPETQSVIYFDFFNKSSSDSDTDNHKYSQFKYFKTYK